VNARKQTPVTLLMDSLIMKRIAHVPAMLSAVTLRKEMEMHADADPNALILLLKLKVLLAVGAPPSKLMFYSHSTTGSLWKLKRTQAVYVKTVTRISTLSSVNPARLVLIHRPTGFSGTLVHPTPTGSRAN
jgi:hypothetical protein